MRELGTGPHKPIQGLDAYLRAEQKAGRISAGADTYAAASLLLGACSQRAFAYEMSPTADRRNRSTSSPGTSPPTLLTGIA